MYFTKIIKHHPIELCTHPYPCLSLWNRWWDGLLCLLEIILASLNKTKKSPKLNRVCSSFCSLELKLREGLSNEKNSSNSRLVILLDQQCINLAVYGPLERKKKVKKRRKKKLLWSKSNCKNTVCLISLDLHSDVAVGHLWWPDTPPRLASEPRSS